MGHVIILFCFLLLIWADDIHGQNPVHQTSNDPLKSLLLQAGAILKESRNASKELTGFVQSSELNQLSGGRPLCRLPCKNGGKCIATDECMCVNEWFGVDCSQFVCTETCLHGSCKGPDSCYCENGWKGADCGSPICNPDCLNQGVCVEPNTCSCLQGYDGDVCEIAVCNPPCTNGICSHGNLCQCLSGWQGDRCDRPVCSPNCQNGGVCVQPQTCECSSSWQGHTCELPVCTKHCQNGGECVSPDVCLCPPGHEGAQCQFGAQRSTSESVCSMWSGRHIRTFDGNSYNFPGRCRYTMVTDCVDRSFAIELVRNVEDFIPINTHTMEIQNQTAFNLLHPKLKSLINRTHDFVGLVLKIRGQPSLTLLPDRIALWGDRVLDSHFAVRGITVSSVGQYVKVDTRLGIVILWNGEGTMEIEVRRGILHGSVCGLCGNADGDSSNDMELPDRTVASSVVWLARGWRVLNLHDHCDEITTEVQECAGLAAGVIESIRTVCEIFITSNDAFGGCLAAGVSPVLMVETCVSDLCLCETDFHPECHCSSVAQYARLCTTQTDVVPQWRKPGFCELQCPDDMVYSECASSCPKTCHDLVTPNNNCHDHCVDGCTCPDGTLLHDGRCVHEDACPCMHNGISYRSSHVLQQECMTCVCESALWNCSERNCASECSAVGDPHFTSFDGLTYTMHGECQYTFVKDCSASNLFSVIVDNSACGSDATVTCKKDVIVALHVPAENLQYRKVIISLNQEQIVSVNEKIIVAPYIKERFQIFQVSSTFTQVRLNVGVTIDWDGASRLYVKAERRWIGKLCGLCGNYNGNQKDDMKNFNGLVETNPVSFGNSWKASSDCIDMQYTQVLEPCQINEQRAPFADTECSILLGDTFRDCHEDVDPQSYYEICRHDVCECYDAVACLCNAISHYARACSHAGHVTEWRSENFCNAPCTGGKTYQECGSSCKSTCRSISDQSVWCDESCVQGCNCPGGLYLDANDHCVEKAHCQCYHNGRIYRAFETMHREFTTCHCVEGRLTCVSVNEKLQMSENGVRSYRSTACPPGQIHKGCHGHERGIECERTCTNLGDDCYAGACVEGCGCRDGLVYDSDRRVCVESSDCPCYYSGRPYLPGHTLVHDCNTCTCVNREWVCSDEPCMGTCTAYSNSHYMTFDRYTYDFMGSCSYILTQDYCGNQQGTFRVYIENRLCNSDASECAKALTIILEDKLSIVLEHDGFGYAIKDLVKWSPASDSADNLTSTTWHHHEVGLYIIVTTNIGITVQWDRKTSVVVTLDPRHKGRVCGLCGNYDDNQNNDAIKSDRIHAVTPWEFGNSWKTSSNCEDADAWLNPCDLNPHRRAWAQRSCNILYSDVFMSCHAQVDVTWFYHNCISDACGCNSGADCDCFCTAVAAYARVCAENGNPIRWRTPNVCPLMCEAYNIEEYDCTWHYDECKSSCPYTCQHKHMFRNGECTLPITCVEGCFPICPNGMIFDEDQRECVSECQPGCYANGKHFNLSEVVVEETCHICTCGAEGELDCVTPAGCIPPTTPAPSTLFTTTPPTSEPYEHVLDLTSVQRFCDGAVNLLFLLHSSDALTPTEFQSLKRVVLTYATAIAPEDYGRNTSLLRVGIKQYGDEIEDALVLLEEQNMSILSHAIHNLELQRSRHNNLAEVLISSARLLNQTNVTGVNSTVGNIMFVIIFSEPQDSISDAVRILEDLNIKSILLSVWDQENVHLHESHDHRSQKYHLHHIDEIFEPSTMISMEILEEICSGTTTVRVKTTTSPTSTPLPTTLTPTVEPTGEQCTMSADLVILIDIELLTSDDDNTARRKRDNVFTFLRTLLQGMTISPSHTNVAILLVDHRLWRVMEFVSSRNNLLDNLDDDVLRALSDHNITSPIRFDLSYALDHVLVEYFDSQIGHARNALSVHKSILVLQGRQPAESLTKPINETISDLQNENTVLTVITNPAAYSNFKDRKSWQRAMMMDNIVFADVANGRGIYKINTIVNKVCRTPTSLPIPLKYCAHPTDVYFLWDGSELTEINDLINMLESTRKITKTLQPLNFAANNGGINRVRVAIIRYSDSFDYVLRLNDDSGLRDFLQRSSPTIPSWNSGIESDLNSVLVAINNSIESTHHTRKATVVIFTATPPKKMSPDHVSALNELRRIGVNFISVAFGSWVTQEDVVSISGSDGLFRVIATSREILDNDLGIFIAEHICVPGELPTTTPPYTTTEAHTVQTKLVATTTSLGTTPVPSCVRPMDIHVIVDSQLARGQDTRTLINEILYHTFTDFAVDDGTMYSRISLQIAGSTIDAKIQLSGDGSNKISLLDRFTDSTSKAALSELPGDIPFKLERSITAGVYLFFEREVRSTSDYDKTFVLVLSRLPSVERELTSTTDGVLGQIKDFRHQGYGFSLVYFNTTFDGVSHARRREWMNVFQGASLLISSTNNSEALGKELADQLCYISLSTTPSPAPTQSTTAVTEPTEYYCENQPIDLVFLLESSVSVGKSSENFDAMKQFVGNVVSPFRISSDVLRVAVAQYGSYVHMDGNSGFSFDRFITRSTLLHRIDDLRESDDQPYQPMLTSAIDNVMGLFTRPSGTALRVVVIVTATRSNMDSLSDVARRAQDSHIFLIMITTPTSSMSPDDNFSTYSEYLNAWIQPHLHDSQLVSIPDGPTHLIDRIDDIRSLICQGETILPKSPIIEIPEATSRGYKTTESLTTLTPRCMIDLMLIVDSSYSISPSDYTALKEFLSEHISHFNVADDITRIGMIQYAATSEVAWGLSRYAGDADGMIDAIGSMRKIQGITNTYTVMIRTLDIELDNLDRGRRNDVPYVVLLITDGRAKDEHKFEEMKHKIDEVTHKANRAGFIFRIVTMGIGSVDRNELSRIATNTNNTFVVHRMSELHNIGQDVTETICQPMHYVPAPAPVNESGCTSMPSTDILFILDGSMTFGEQRPMPGYKSMLNQLTSQFDIRTRHTQVGVYFYDNMLHDTPPSGFQLDAFHDVTELQEAINNLQYPNQLKMRGAPYIEEAINDKFNISSGGRPDARKVAVIVITSLDIPSFDGSVPTIDDVITGAVLKGNDVIVVVVPPTSGMADMKDDLIGSVGSAVEQSNLIWVPGSFPELPNYVGQLRDLICGTPVVTTTPEGIPSTTARPISDQCGMPSNDVVVLMDGSMNINRKLHGNISPVKNFINEFSSKFVISDDKTLVSVIAYDNVIHTSQPYFVATNQYGGNIERLHAAVNFMSIPMSSMRNTGQVLRDFISKYQDGRIPGLSGTSRVKNLVILLDVDEVDQFQSLQRGIESLASSQFNVYVIVVGATMDHSDLNGQGHAEVNGVNGQGHAEVNGVNGQGHAEVNGVNGQGHAEVNGVNGQGQPEVNGVNGQGHAEVNGVNGQGHAEANRVNDQGQRHINLAHLTNLANNLQNIKIIPANGGYDNLNDVVGLLWTMICHGTTTTHPVSGSTSVTDMTPAMYDTGSPAPLPAVTTTELVPGQPRRTTEIDSSDRLTFSTESYSTTAPSCDYDSNDVVVMFDGSSNANADVSLIKSFVDLLASKFILSNSKTLFGVITYDEVVHTTSPYFIATNQYNGNYEALQENLNILSTPLSTRRNAGLALTDFASKFEDGRISGLSGTSRVKNLVILLDVDEVDQFQSLQRGIESLASSQFNVYVIVVRTTVESTQSDNGGLPPNFNLARLVNLINSYQSMNYILLDGGYSNLLSEDSLSRLKLMICEGLPQVATSTPFVTGAQQTTTISTPVVPGAQQTTTESTPVVPGAQQTTTSTTFVPGAQQTTTSTFVPGAQQTTTTSTPVVPGAQQTTTSKPFVPGAQHTTTSTTSVPGAQQTTTSTFVPGAQQTTTTSTPVVPGAQQTTTSKPFVPGAQHTTTSTTSVPGAQQTTTSTFVSGAQQTTTTSTFVSGAQQTTTTSTPVVPGAQQTTTSKPFVPGAQHTTTSTTSVPGAQQTSTFVPGAQQTTTTSTPVVPGAQQTTTSKPFVPGAQQTTTTSTPVVPGAQQTTTSKPFVPGAQQTTTTSTPVVPGAQQTTTSKPFVPGAQQTTTTSTPVVPGAQQTTTTLGQTTLTQTATYLITHKLTHPPLDMVCPAEDIVFIFDSFLIGHSSEADHVNRFLQSIVGMVGSQEKSRFSLVTYGDNPEVKFALTTYSTVPGVIHALETIVHDGPSTVANVGKALKFSLSSSASAPQEDGHVRRRQFLLLMGRRSSDNMLTSVDEARRLGVDIITFMVGDLRIENSARLSTVPYGDIDVHELHDLENLRYEVLELICTVPVTAQTTPMSATTTAYAIAPCKVDAIFIIDDSLTSSSRFLRPLRKYLNIIASNLVFGSDHFMAGLYKLGADFNLISRGLASTKETFVNDLQNELQVAPSSGPLSMTTGLAEAENILDEFGRKDLNDSKRMIVFLMRRRPNDFIPTAKMNELLTNNTIIVSVVMDDASTVDRSLLTNRMAYVNAYRSSFLYYYAVPVVYMMWDSVCEGVYKYVPTTTTQVSTTTTVPTFSATSAMICSYAHDMVVVIDLSGISSSRLNKLKEFLRLILQKFEIGRANTRVAFVTYDSTPHLISNLGSDDILIHLQNLRPSVGTITNTGLALSEVTSNVLTHDHGARTDVPWTILLITDGRSKDDLTTPLRQLSALSSSHRAGVNVVALGLLSASTDELQRIASSVTYVESYDNLDTNTPMQSVYGHLCGPSSLQRSTPRMTSVTSSTLTSMEVCECSWTEYISRDLPTHDSLGDLEMWASRKMKFGGVCGEGSRGVQVKCKSDFGQLQSNVVCDHRVPLRCLHIDVPYDEGPWCHNYSISVKCCSKHCAHVATKPPAILTPQCVGMFDIVFVVDRSTSSTAYLQHVSAFLYDITTRFLLSPETSRVAIVEYGTSDARVVSGFETNSTIIAEHLQSLSPSSVGASDAGNALNIIYYELTSGVRHVGGNGEAVKKIVVFVANSHSMGAVEGMMNVLLYEYDFQFVAIGMNGVSRNLLSRLSSDQDDKVFETSDLEELRTEIPQRVTEAICERIIEVPPYDEYEYGGGFYEYEEEFPATTARLESVPVTETTEGIETTTSKVQCSYFNETSNTATLLDIHELVYPDPYDVCLYYKCKDDGTLSLRNKQLLCDKSRKPSCGNGLEAMLYYDGNCNCQWGCQCYCNVAGDPVFHSFDGLSYSYSAPPGCQNVLSQPSRSAILDSHYQVLHTTGPCHPIYPEATSCVVEVTVILGEKSFELRKDLEATLNDFPISLPYTDDEARMSLAVVGGRKFILRSTDVGLEVKFDPFTHSVTVALPAYQWDSRTEGMCGNCNRRKEDDLVLKNGTIVDDAVEFGYSWTANASVATCAKPLPINSCVRDYDPLCNMINDAGEFAECRNSINYDRYFLACKLDTCTKNYSACDSLAAFAEVCRHSGLCVDWRNSSVCPVSCPSGFIFEPCRRPPFDKLCDGDTPLDDTHEPSEGCFLNCSDTEVVHEGTCKPPEVCTMCYDSDAGVYRKTGAAWIHPMRSCSVCSCDAITLEINCSNRTCSNTTQPPTCGVCESHRIIPDSDLCCPQYTCECDYSNCTAVRPITCRDGEVERRNSTVIGCRPVYECQCIVSECSPSPIECNPPFIPTLTSTTCCDEYKCICPACRPTPAPCTLGYETRYETDACNCTEVRCEPDQVCLVNNSIVQVRRSKWTPGRCVSCECTDEIGSDGFHVSICNNVTCLPCPHNYKRIMNSRSCCGVCRPSVCDVTIDLDNTTRTMQIGENYQSRCTIYQCVAAESGFAINLQTQRECKSMNHTQCINDGGSIVYDEDGCCSECQMPLGSCQVMESNAKLYTVSGCVTDRPIALTYCEGHCTSGSHYHELTGQFVRFCSCCSAYKYYNQSHPATCTDGTQRELQFRVITSCKCDRGVVCETWTRDGDFQARMSNNLTSDTAVVATWSTGQSHQVRVIGVNDIPSDGARDTFGVVQAALAQFGLQNTHLKVVQVSNSGEDLNTTLARGIDAAFSNVGSINPPTESTPVVAFEEPDRYDDTHTDYTGYYEESEEK